MPSSALETHVSTDSAEFKKNTRALVDLLTEIKNQEEHICEGGGAKAIESQHKKGRLTARERIAKLIDPGTQFFELWALRRLRNVRGMGRRARRRHDHRTRPRLRPPRHDHRQRRHGKSRRVLPA